MKYAILVVILTFFMGCNKPDPNPEKQDEIYKDLSAEFELATKRLEAETKNLTKLESEKEKVIPQTGQIKFAVRKINETQATITKLQQQKQFFEIKLELRKNDVRDRYMEARRGGRKWPDPEEIIAYQSFIKMQRQKLEWDKNKGVKKNVPHGTGAKSEHGAPPAAEHH